MKRTATTLLLLASSALVGAAAERTWTDSTGKFRVEADLVEVQDGTVVLRRANGQVVKVPLNRLSEKDQQFVAEHSAKDAAGLTNDLKITAEPEWGMVGFGPDGADAEGPPLEVSVIMRGKAAAQASAFGDLKLETIKDSQGRTLKGELKTMMGGFADTEDEMRQIDRANQFDRHPKDGVRIPIQIAISEPPIESIKELRGSVNLRTGGRYEEAVVENVKQHLNQQIESEVLEQADISVRVSSRARGEASPDGGLGIGFGEEATETIVIDAKGKLEPLVRVELLGPDGKPLDPTMSGSAGFGQQMQYTFGFADPIPDSAKLRVVLHLNGEVVTVPFALENIKVPPVPKQPSGFPGFPGG